MVANDAQQGGFLAQVATGLGIDTVAVVTDEKQVSQGLANDFRTAFVASGGIGPLLRSRPRRRHGLRAVRATRRGDRIRDCSSSAASTITPPC